VPARISSFGRTILRPFRSTASLLCHAVGQPTLRREWLRGDQILRAGSNLKIQIIDSGELLISDLQQSDSGNYTCQVGNSHGSDHIQYIVTVQGETQNMGHKGPILRPRCIRPGRARAQIPFKVRFCMRHTQLKSVCECPQVKVLYQLQETTTGI